MAVYADIAEVRTVTTAAACNQLLAEGWVLLGIYPLTTVGEMAPRESDGEQEEKQKQPQSTQQNFGMASSKNIYRIALRAYPNIPAARKAMSAQAKCRKAR